MSNWLWLALPVIGLIAGGALWLAASRPDFWIGLVKAIVKDILPSLGKLFHRKSPAEEAEDRARARRGEPPNKRRPGAGR